MIPVFTSRIPEKLPGSCLTALSEYRKEKLSRLQDPAARRQSLAAELLLKKMLTEFVPELSWPPHIVCGEHGKPFLADSPWYFSLSHSGDWVACALAQQEIGLDIQVKTMASPRLLERCFTPEESQQIRESEDPERAFTRLWCRKESFLKAEGIGFSQGFSQVGSPNADCGFHFWDVEELCLCLCVPGDRKPVAKLYETKLL